MKICTECKYVIIGDQERPQYAKCSRFKRDDNTLSLVIGKEATEKFGPKYSYCTTAREFTDMCGPEGTKWEPKEEVQP